MWSQQEAIELACKIEQIAPAFGAHVALTGGTLYKKGLRKDVDIMLYRIRQVPSIDRVALLNAIEADNVGVMGSTHGWVQKMWVGGRVVDLFFPDYVDTTPDNYGTNGSSGGGIV